MSTFVGTLIDPSCIETGWTTGDLYEPAFYNFRIINGAERIFGIAE